MGGRAVAGDDTAWRAVVLALHVGTPSPVEGRALLLDSGESSYGAIQSVGLRRANCYWLFVRFRPRRGFSRMIA